jgi:hypothetical protein
MENVLLMLRVVAPTSEQLLTLMDWPNVYKINAQVMNTKPLMVSVLQMELSAHKVPEKMLSN